MISATQEVRLFALPALLAGAAIATYFAATGLLAQAVGARDPSPDAALLARGGVCLVKIRRNF